VSEKIRHEITPTVNNIIDSIRTLIALHPDGPLAVAAFRALRIIGLTTCPGEESSLMNILPLVITAIRGRKMAPSAMAALSSLAFVKLLYTL
jgi:U3 small nucleolar RNA-associated protein 10